MQSSPSHHERRLSEHRLGLRQRRACRAGRNLPAGDRCPDPAGRDAALVASHAVGVLTAVGAAAAVAGDARKIADGVDAVRVRGASGRISLPIAAADNLWCADDASLRLALSLLIGRAAGVAGKVAPLADVALPSSDAAADAVRSTAPTRSTAAARSAAPARCAACAGATRGAARLTAAARCPAGSAPSRHAGRTATARRTGGSASSRRAARAAVARRAPGSRCAAGAACLTTRTGAADVAGCATDPGTAGRATGLAAGACRSRAAGDPARLPASTAVAGATRRPGLTASVSTLPAIRASTVGACEDEETPGEQREPFHGAGAQQRTCHARGCLCDQMFAALAPPPAPRSRIFEAAQIRKAGSRTSLPEQSPDK